MAFSFRCGRARLRHFDFARRLEPHLLAIGHFRILSDVVNMAFTRRARAGLRPGGLLCKRMAVGTQVRGKPASCRRASAVITVSQLSSKCHDLGHVGTPRTEGCRRPWLLARGSLSTKIDQLAWFAHLPF